MPTIDEQIGLLTAKEAQLVGDLNKIRKITDSLKLIAPRIDNRLVSGSEETKDAVYEEILTKKIDPNTLDEITDARIAEIQASLSAKITTALL